MPFGHASVDIGGDDMAKHPAGFVSLQSLKKGPPDPAAALAEIRRIYFKTTRQTHRTRSRARHRAAQEPGQ